MVLNIAQVEDALVHWAVNTLPWLVRPGLPSTQVINFYFAAAAFIVFCLFSHDNHHMPVTAVVR